MSHENRIAVASLRGTVPAPGNLSLAPALRGPGLTKRDSGVTVVDQVDIDARAGSIRAVIGENGAGKSPRRSAVLVRIDRPSSGNAALTGWVRAR